MPLTKYLLPGMPASALHAQTNPYSSSNTPDPFKNTKMSEQEIQQFCSSGQGGTQGQTACARHQWLLNDQRLKEIFSKALEQQKIADKKLVTGASSYMKAAQNDWERYRKNNCDVVYYQLCTGDVTKGGGTGVPAEYMDCMANMAGQRIKELSRQDTPN